ncbi:3-oxoacyl-ACP reductase FabG [Frankia sp. AgB1.9]|uniref:SDR family NAD(P)-dependent oxidoreductase n=1 Tax=unclassified Frankia TaxID=2632575 RepID=UPI001933B47A|nr:MULTISPECIES: 3-oxoacyl-ACP reductase FabG [unclassified Frankia]MBL7488818.1 3-oxoacyl-ACP reductase FabG [Frankia sp. AgW1.1]MBL7546461.1 3-oxoacyl-ACP reductase FabG [Frankia sp. AgB1.9]MBL7620280.1 3-oxoacyl-ACP reductase FabG [Frankia sp. AgB1.8]
MSARTAIVTGGGSGIGGAISQRLAADGALVAVFDLSGDAAKAAAESIEKAGGKAIGVPVDVTNRAGIDAGIDEVLARLGPPTILVNNAGLTVEDKFLETTAEAWHRMLAVNLTGTFDCCQAVLPHMIENGWGRIINISSSSVYGPPPGLAGYVAAKSGVVGLSKVLALEFARYGVTVNTIPPGFIDTPMLRDTVQRGFIDVDQQIEKTPVGRIGRPEDIAAACAFLASDEAGYITGQSLGINGGRVI